MTRAVDSLTVALDPLPLEEGTVVCGAPVAGLTTLAAITGRSAGRSDDRPDVEAGVWELTEGVVTDTEADEVFVVVAGAGTVRFEDGETVGLRPGVVVRLREGERTTWTITETLRKVWVAG